MTEATNGMLIMILVAVVLLPIIAIILMFGTFKKGWNKKSKNVE